MNSSKKSHLEISKEEGSLLGFLFASLIIPSTKDDGFILELSLDNFLLEEVTYLLSVTLA